MQEKHDFFRFGNMCDRKGLEIEYFKEATRDAFNIYIFNIYFFQYNFQRSHKRCFQALKA